MIELLNEKIDFCESVGATMFKRPLKVRLSKNMELKGEIFGKSNEGNAFIIFIEKNVFFLSTEMLLAAGFDILQKGMKQFILNWLFFNEIYYKIH